jgi:hypothetical protein
MSWQVEEARTAHIFRLAETLREADREEVMASAGVAPLKALDSSLLASQAAWTLLIEGRPSAMWGVAPSHSPEMGVAWMLASDEIYQSPRKVWTLSKNFVAGMHELYPVLGNWVDERNKVSQRWLMRLGFLPVGVDRTFGVARIPFTKYERDIRNV